MTKSRILPVDKEWLFRESETYFNRICGVTVETDQYAWILKERYGEQLIPRLIIREGEDGKIYYAMTIEDICGLDKMDLLDQFYIDVWMTAYMDAARAWLLTYLSETDRNKKETVRLTGPGFDGIPLSETEKYLHQSDAEKIGITIKNGMLHPLKSNVGHITWDGILQGADCEHCLSGRTNCSFCFYHQEKE